MKRHWFKMLMGVAAMMALGVGEFFSPNQAAAFQAASTPEGVIATVTYPDPINVRGGPSTVHYPIVGQLFPGDVVQALGVSPGHEWVQIAFSASPSGKAWVYAVFVTVSGGELPVVEAPPTPTPPVTATIDPTFAAAFEIQPTQTRMPTFTPPPPLTVPAFEDERSAGLGFGGFIVGLGVLGLIGLIATFILRR